MKTTILLIINPKAGSINPPLILSKVREEAARQKINIEVFETSFDNDKEKIRQKLDAANFSRVLVAGGDGTVNFVASILIETSLTMGILACGSANGLATALKLPDSLDEQIQIALAGKHVAMDCILVNKNLCLHIADLGINAELIYNFDNAKTRGFLGYFLHSIPTLLKSNYPYRFTIHMKTKTIEKKGILLALANASKYGTGAVINPKGEINDGKFEVVLFKKMNFLHILKTFFNKSKLHPEFAEGYCVEEATITSKKPIALQVDGEYLGKFEEINAAIKPNALKVAIY